ncbi:MAG TPA: PEP-CTERM sorting domain-containing protein [Steroidobacteraceae bacterium]|jgi:hypothetical protein|nr:PEP-CTERM sorting domain-containing protein [Steroidobacteraceae bacterium]
MSHTKFKTVAVASVLLGAASAAQAGFVPINNVTPIADTIGIVNSNDFKSIFAGLGVTTYTLGASLGTDAAGLVTYYYYGKEAGYENVFKSGALSYTSGFTPQTQNYFAAPVTIGSVSVGAGMLNFGFCAYSAPGASQGCITNAQNDALGINSLQSIAFSATGNVAWLFWDDSGAGPDDNHDDMLIKAVFQPASVPEPATLGLLGLGLLGTWLSVKRRLRLS